jgi:hypothetical protein
MIESLGVFGLITNLAFSAVWQFVDMSTWQSVIASKRGDAGAIRALKESGIAVFIAPGVIGTILGALLVNATGVTSDNVMSQIMELLPNSRALVFVVFVALLATIMSMVDGALLAASYSFVCDILFRKFSLKEIDENQKRSYVVLAFLRVSLLLVAIGGGLGVNYLVEHGISLFNVTYVLVIGQLALAGPVLTALRGHRQANDRMAWSIFAGLVVGFGSLYGGLSFPDQVWLLTGAGFFASVASYVIATLVSAVQMPEISVVEVAK